MLTWDEVRALLSRPIAFYPIFARIGGSVNAGLFLSQAFYWTNTLTEARDGWFYKKRDDWEAETFLSRREQEGARKSLRDAGLLEERQCGVPPTLHYRINKGKLLSEMARVSKEIAAEMKLKETALPQSVELRSQLVQNRPIKRAETAQSNGLSAPNSTIQENTAENTAEREGKPPATNKGKPTEIEVATFFRANGSTGAEAREYWDFYQSKGWLVGKVPMKDWQAAARRWIRKAIEEGRDRRPGTVSSSGVPMGPVVSHLNSLTERNLQRIRSVQGREQEH
jgi:hypothetical protein